MAHIHILTEGLAELWAPTWLITAGRNDYVYVGPKAGLKDAISTVEAANRGKSVRYRSIAK